MVSARVPSHFKRSLILNSFKLCILTLSTQHNTHVTSPTFQELSLHYTPLKMIKTSRNTYKVCGYI